MKCAKRYKLLLGFIKIRDKHVFTISNAFCTLEDKNVIDVIRTCLDCQFKEVLTLDRETILELIERYPNAFQDDIRSYLSTWMN